METLTKITSAHVKVMLSHDYNHFEASMGLSNENGLTPTELDNARKECQRLCDKAVSQYVMHKNVLFRNRDDDNAYNDLVSKVNRIRNVPDSELTVRDKANRKELADWKWQDSRHYDYEDDYQLQDREDLDSANEPELCF